MDDDAALSQRAARFAACGSDSWVVQDVDDPSHVILVGSYCGDRFCIPCARTRSHVITENLNRHAPPGPYRLITLTLPSSHDLPAILGRLYQSWARLRQSAAFRDHVTGGICFLELTHSETNGWHPHFHLIAVGSYWPQRDLTDAWGACSREVSPIVDIRRCRDFPTMLGYLSKYATKLTPPSVTHSSTLLAEAITALAARRAVATFGSWRGLRLLTPLPSDHEWRLCGTLSWVHCEARHGNQRCQRLLDYLNYPDTIRCGWDEVFPNKSPPALQPKLFDTHPCW